MRWLDLALSEEQEEEKIPPFFNKSTKKHVCCGRLDEDQQGVNDRADEIRSPEPRSLCVNTVTPVRGRGPARFILWGLETCRRANC